jgi:hypothetical protein
MMDFSTILFRCSSVGHLMTEPKTKAAKEAGELSESAKTHLIDIYVSNKYRRQTDVQSKYISKGLLVEEDSITLYSRMKKRFFKKNEDGLSNDFLKGTPDLYEGTSINSATHIIDVKSSWDIYTFHRVLTKGINDIYYWQLQGYMALTGAKKATLAYCLIDTPPSLIEDEKRRLMYKMGSISTEDPAYQEACTELDRLMIYEDIPIRERVIETEISRKDEDISAMYAKIQKGRQWLNEFEKSRFPGDILLAEHDQEVNATIIQ